MPRDITTEVQAEFDADRVRLCILADLQFINDYTLFLTTGPYDLTWNGNLYLGNGWLRQVQGINESTELKAVGCTVTLTGVGDEIMSLVLASTSQKLKGIIRLTALDDSGAIIDDPVILFKGNLDVPTIVDSPDESTVRITYESDLIRLSKSNDFRYTDAAQKSKYPDDRGFEYMHSLEKWDGYWGVKKDKKTKKDKKANVKEHNRT